MFEYIIYMVWWPTQQLFGWNTQDENVCGSKTDTQILSQLACTFDLASGDS